MGNQVCKKCGINYGYYLNLGFKEYSRPSCRIAYPYEKENNHKGNYYHDWKYRVF